MLYVFIKVRVLSIHIIKKVIIILYILLYEYFIIKGFPGGSDSKVSVCNSGDPGSIPGSGRCPGERNGTPLQYSCLENPMDREAGYATIHGVAKSQTRWSDFTFSLPSPNNMKDLWGLSSFPKYIFGVHPCHSRTSTSFSCAVEQGSTVQIHHILFIPPPGISI